MSLRRGAPGTTGPRQRAKGRCRSWRAEGAEERGRITRRKLLDRRKAILEIARRHGAHDVRVIGSIARGEADETSDLDLVVRFDPDRTLLDHGELIMDLRDLLGVEVDVISEAGMRDRFRRHVMKEAVALSGPIGCSCPRFGPSSIRCRPRKTLNSALRPL
ncbi:MAG: nucleotidyltransferase family protein [Candidatus Brocadiia bacterium]